MAAKLDPEWGRQHFDEVLLYIRDFANPLEDDHYFPQYRQKDWFLGSSWASGIVSAENSPHGRNEESSSEAISGYEGVTLFGSAMVDAFTEEIDTTTNGDVSTIKKKLETATLIRDSGQLLTATEISAANRYWHVWSSDTHTNAYPKEYTQPVVGMLYDTMATFQTWYVVEILFVCPPSHRTHIVCFTPQVLCVDFCAYVICVTDLSLPLFSLSLSHALSSVFCHHSYAML